MDMLLIVLSTAIGTVVGVAASILMTQRKKQPSPNTAIMQQHLQKLEAALAGAASTMEDLQKQIAERDRNLETRAEELKVKDQEAQQAREQAEKAISARS